jgi:ribosome-binding protein aMBF1 (putative translation factor)
MEHQDWKPVTTGTKQSIDSQIRSGKLKKEIVAKDGAGQNKQLASSSDLDPRVIEANEIGTIPTPSKAVSDQIRDARVAKRWTQVELNQKCSFPPGTVRDYESGVATYKQQEIDKMSRVLGVVIKKNIPKNKKA